MAVNWQIATVEEIIQETPRVKTFVFSLPDWKPHMAGQHYDLRLTAPDGYQTIRKYSIASAPDRQARIALTIDLLEGGEVSEYMHGVIIPGDQVEIRGPIGGYFVWHPGLNQPLLLVAGGSGIVPLMSMIRHKLSAEVDSSVVLLYSAKSEEDLIYKRELDLFSNNNSVRIYYTLTRNIPPTWKGYTRRIDEEMLTDMLHLFDRKPLVYVCGPTAMVEYVSHELVAFGIPGAKIRTERFGPSG